jgi:CRISPR/Cas system-associated endoribonuclease Cas2
MNNLPYTTIVGWETRNWRHRKQALVWCKDYGLKAINSRVFIGELYAKERSLMQSKFKELFTKKTEKFFFVTLCKSCFNESMIGANVTYKPKHSMPFELVQMPENG